MKIKLTLIILTVFLNSLCSQNETTTKPTKQIGVYSTLDLVYNLSDKVINPGLGRKICTGLTLTNKKRQYLFLIGAGLKGIKLNIYSPTLNQSFIKDINDNYVTIADSNEAQAIGTLMGPGKGHAFNGTLAYYLHFGFILNYKIKPSINFYCGAEDFFLYDRSLTKYVDPVDRDIHYVNMTTKFYEIKLGSTLPLKIFVKKPFCVNFNIGYKWVDYGSFKFHNTPISDYTTGSLANKYRYNGKLNFSLSFAIFSKNLK